MRIAIQLIAAFLGSLGFSIVFHVRKNLLLPCACGAMIDWGLYLFVSEWISGSFLPALTASAAAAVVAEILARIYRAPSTIFFITVVIPMIPGGSLYYMMSSIVQKNPQMTVYYGNQLLYMVLGIAGGLALVSAAKQLFPDAGSRR